MDGIEKFIPRSQISDIVKADGTKEKQKTYGKGLGKKTIGTLKALNKT